MLTTKRVQPSQLCSSSPRNPLIYPSALSPPSFSLSLCPRILNACMHALTTILASLSVLATLHRMPLVIAVVEMTTNENVNREMLLSPLKLQHSQLIMSTHLNFHLLPIINIYPSTINFTTSYIYLINRENITPNFYIKFAEY